MTSLVITLWFCCPFRIIYGP